MANLPYELLAQIISYLPSPSLPSIRLVSHQFSKIAFNSIFSHLISKWLDYEISHKSIISLAHDVCNRPAVMWSPWASEPDRAVDDVFLELVWRLVTGRVMDEGFVVPLANTDTVKGSEVMDGLDSRAVGEGQGDQRVKLTASNFAALSGREEITETRLKTGQNRFLLHRSILIDAWVEKSQGG